MLELLNPPAIRDSELLWGSVEDKGTGKEDKRLDVPFGNVDDEPTEGTKGLDIGKGGRELIEVIEVVGAMGKSEGIDGGMDKFGILPIP